MAPSTASGTSDDRADLRAGAEAAAIALLVLEIA